MSRLYLNILLCLERSEIQRQDGGSLHNTRRRSLRSGPSLLVQMAWQSPTRSTDRQVKTLVLFNWFCLQEPQAESSSGKWPWTSLCLPCLTTLHSMWASTSSLEQTSRNLCLNWNRNYSQQFSQRQRSGCLLRRWIFGETRHVLVLNWRRIIFCLCLRFVSPQYRVLYLAGCTFIEFNILALFKKLDPNFFKS